MNTNFNDLSQFTIFELSGLFNFSKKLLELKINCHTYFPYGIPINYSKNNYKEKALLINIIIYKNNLTYKIQHDIDSITLNEKQFTFNEPFETLYNKPYDEIEIIKDVVEMEINTRYKIGRKLK